MPRLRFLSRGEVEAIHEASLDVLEGTGGVLISRRDFILGISLGILGNIIASYIIELDIMIFPIEAWVILLRVTIIGLALGYILYNYWKETKKFENRIHSLICTRNNIENRINSIEEVYLKK